MLPCRTVWFHAGSAIAQMLKHNVIAWIGDEPAGAQLIRTRPIISFSPIASIAGVEEIGIRSA
jgi:hypothetical protein